MSEHANRMARILAHAQAVFGNYQKASNWLQAPKPRFGNRTPREMAETEAGASLVEEMLWQIDDGMFV